MNTRIEHDGFHADKTEKIIKCFFEVYNNLGYGYLEKVYRNAMLIELAESGFKANSESPVTVYYKGHNIGDYRSDILVDNVIFLELKAAENLTESDDKQLINYLKSTKIEVGLVLGFCKKPEIRRRIFTNDKKKLR